MHFYSIKLKKRVDYVKNPSTLCYKGQLKKNQMSVYLIRNNLFIIYLDLYSNDFENYSKSICASFNLKTERKQKLNDKYNKENLNSSLCSNENFNSVISSIDSSSANSFLSTNSGNCKYKNLLNNSKNSSTKHNERNEENKFISKTGENVDQNLQM